MYLIIIVSGLFCLDRLDRSWIAIQERSRAIQGISNLQLCDVKCKSRNDPGQSRAIQGDPGRSALDRPGSSRIVWDRLGSSGLVLGSSGLVLGSSGIGFSLRKVANLRNLGSIWAHLGSIWDWTFISQNCKLEIPRIVWDRLGSSGIAPGSFTGSKYVVPSVFVGFSNLCDSTEIEIPIEK